MRVSILLLSSVITLAACGDDRTPSAPQTAPATGSASVIANPGGLSGAPAPQAKPQQAVGFTKIEYIEGQPTTVPAGPGGYATYAFCPTGSVPVGGGFIFIGPAPGAVPYISQSSRVTTPSKEVGWGVGIANNYPGATTVEIAATVLCAS